MLSAVVLPLAGFVSVTVGEIASSGRTVVVSVSWLFDEFPSELALETVAVLLSVPLPTEVGVTTIVICASPALAMEPR